jgi:hypothetical protein
LADLEQSFDLIDSQAQADGGHTVFYHQRKAGLEKPIAIDLCSDQVPIPRCKSHGVRLVCPACRAAKAGSVTSEAKAVKPQTQPNQQGQRKDNDGLHRRRGVWHYKLKVGGKWKEYSPTPTITRRHGRFASRRSMTRRRESCLLIWPRGVF